MTRLLAVLTASLVAGLVAAVAAVPPRPTPPPARSASRRPPTSPRTGRSAATTPRSAIPSSGPASTYPAPIQVSGLTGTITDVDVRLNTLNHPFPSDLDVMLVGPGGQHVVLMSDAGSNVAVVDTTFFIDDEAPSPLPGLGQINTDSVPADELRVRRPVPGASPQRLRRRHRAVGLRRHRPQRRLEPVRRRRHPDGQRQPQGRLEPVDRHHGDRPALSLHPAGLRRAGHGHRRRPGARRPAETSSSRTWTCSSSARPAQRAVVMSDVGTFAPHAAGQPGPRRRGHLLDGQHARRQPGLAADRQGPARADPGRCRSPGRSDRGTSTRQARHPTCSARPPPTPPVPARRSRSSTAPTPTGSGGSSS